MPSTIGDHLAVFPPPSRQHSTGADYHPRTVETPLSTKPSEIPDPFVIERSYDVHPAAVFAAWSDPQLFRQWAWTSLGKNTQGEIDFQVSDQYSIATTP